MRQRYTGLIVGFWVTAMDVDLVLGYTDLSPKRKLLKSSIIGQSIDKESQTTITVPDGSDWLPCP